MPFTKLRDVGLDQLDEALTGFTDDDWRELEQAHLDPLGHWVVQSLDLLGIDADADSVLMYCRLYQHLLARHPEV